MAQMKEEIKTPERELSDEEIANLSDADFKTLDAYRNDWVWSQNRGRSKAYAKWNKEKYNSEGKETQTQIKDLEQKEEINIQLEQNEENRI